MNMRQPKIILVALVCFASLCSISSVYAKIPEKEAILQSCAQLFGAAVDAKQNLFEVNQAFVLQVTFNKRGKLAEFAVKPKYFFNDTHPEWKEPDLFPSLSPSEFRDLITRLDAMKPKGRLLKPRSNFRVVTNLTTYPKEIYKHAVLEWGELGDHSVRFFSIGYLKSK